MDSLTESLVLDLLEWLAQLDRSYDEVMDAWRTSCPRLPVWEDAESAHAILESLGSIASEQHDLRSY
jgi:hypothetical protein